MASWTDNPQINFKPYVSQLPVEAMISVGAEKQRRYEEGVQRIQSSVDRIAGLDIARDVDKQYLRSKLGELGNKLKLVAAGDFSNYQLTNSVGGMVSKVGRDENIISAVTSTAKMKEEDAAMKEAIKNGKSSANREYDYLKAKSEWLNDENVGTPYSARYKEHIDVNKKVLDVIQKLNPNVNVYDIPYVINSDGTINYGSIHSVMTRRGEKGITEGQIRTAVSAMLDANDYDELASQGRYNYKDYNSDDLHKQLTRQYLSTKQRYKESLKEMEKKLMLTTDAEEQKNLNQAIDYYKGLVGTDKVKGVLDDEFTSLSEQLHDNPDNIRAKMYTKNWLDEVSNGFAYRETEAKIMDNPYQDYFIKMAQLDIERSKAASSSSGKKTTEASADDIYFKPSGDETTKNNEALKNWNDYNASIERDNKDILMKVAENYSSVDHKFTAEDVMEKIEEYKNGKYSPNTDEAAVFDRYIRNINFLAAQKDLYSAYEKQAGEELTNEIGNLVVRTEKGDMVYTPVDISKYLSKEKKKLTSYSSSPGGVLTVSTLSINDDDLSEKEKALKNIIANRYISNTGKTGNKNIDDYFDKILEGGDKIINTIAGKMSSITGEFQTQSSSVTFGDTNDRKAFVDNLAMVVSADLGVKAWKGDAGRFGYNPKEAINDIRDENVSFTLTRKGNSYQIDVIGKNKHSIPVTEEFIAKNPILGTGYLNTELDMAQQLLRNKGTTNAFKDYDHAYYRKNSFGFIKDGEPTVTIPIVADIYTGLQGNFFPDIKLKLPDGSVIKPSGEFDRLPSRAEFETWMKTLTDDMIFELFEKRGYPNIRKEFE